MLFIHTWEKVLSGEKTQTRRVVKPLHCAWANSYDEHDDPIEITHVANVIDDPGSYKTVELYRIGKTYAVCPGRGKTQVARIRITDIRREDVRNISDSDALAEGFKSYREFLALWVRMHDKNWWMPKMNNDANLAYSYHKHMMGFLYLTERPAEHYQAWALTFELVK